MMMIDLAVPRDIDPDVPSLPAWRCTTSTTCRRSSPATARSARAEARKAEGIVEEEIQNFAAWLGSLECCPTLAALRVRGQEIAEQVIRENDGKWESASDT